MCFSQESDIGDSVNEGRAKCGSAVRADDLGASPPGMFDKSARVPVPVSSSVAECWPG